MTAAPIAAKPTRYAGYHFRSRLEARWAVFFDALKLRWQYEPEGFTAQALYTPDGGEYVNYLPDFLVDGLWYVEVKGAPEALRKDMTRLWDIVDWDSPMPGMRNSLGSDTKSGLIILGDIPDPRDHWEGPYALRHCKGVHVEKLMVTPCGFMTVSGPLPRLNPFPPFSPIEEYRQLLAGWDDPEYRKATPELRFSRDDIRRALVAARSARFEHGQCGAT